MTMNQLAQKDFFTRVDYYSAMQSEYGSENVHALSYSLRKNVANGTIIHIGRNQYAFPQSKRAYSPVYSSETLAVANEILSEYPDIEFQIFELIQLNAFVNHQFAHNTIFISVENALIDYVFDSLRRMHPGQIMLKPKVDDYYKYLVDNQLVITRLPSESPKGIFEKWQSRLEKILVDISVDKLLSRIIPESEYDNIFSESLRHYYIDIGSMERYASRRGALDKFKTILNEYTMEGHP